MPTILIIDDHVVTTEQYARILRLEGFSVQTALDAASALRLASDAPPDAILVDLRMPMVDGLAFLRAVETKYPGRSRRAALITGDPFVDSAEEEAAKSLGARLVFKPLWTDQLVALVAALLGNEQ